MKRDADIRKNLYAIVNAVLTGETAGSNGLPRTMVICSWVESRKVIWSWVESQVTRHDEGVVKPALIKSTKELMVEPPATVELGLCSALFMMSFTIFSSLRWS